MGWLEINLDFSGAREGGERSTDGSSRPALIGKLVRHSFQKDAGEETREGLVIL